LTGCRAFLSCGADLPNRSPRQVDPLKTGQGDRSRFALRKRGPFQGAVAPGTFVRLGNILKKRPEGTSSRFRRSHNLSLTLAIKHDQVVAYSY
jgi:hypothetical protein